MKLKFTFAILLLSSSLFAQIIVTTLPQYPTQTDNITITFDITHQTDSRTLVGYSGNVYAHTGVYINNDNSTWKHVIGTWGNNSTQPQMTRVSANVYSIVINNPRNFYGVTSSSENITTLNFVLRSADGTKQTEDIHVSIYSAGISIVLNSPKVNLNYGDPMRSPVFISQGGTQQISATSTAGTSTKSITLFINGEQKYQSNSSTLEYLFSSNDNPSWKNIVKIIAEDFTGKKDSTQFAIVTNPPMNDAPLPAGIQIGINYDNDPTKVTLALYAPYKNNIYVIGDFNDWKVDQAYYMNRYQVRPDSVIWWITISNLTPGQEYAYQFLIDGSLRIQDPYTEKILDPWNDSYITSATYPNLKPYPTNMTEGIVGTFQTAQPAYNWKVQTFNRPAKDRLVIYELLVRDFVLTHSYVTLKDTLSYFRKLGVNAIELMPINEFEGDSSWGYNPMMYFAPDKYYGTKDQLKDFIDACHQIGIAVIMDIVLNHSYGLSPMVRMYWDSTNNRPAANNPWFNQTSPNTSFSWGYDFNHESKATKYFVDRVTSFWLSNYKIDGFRFDFSKGFTNTPGDGFAYDASRIAILERMADKIWQVSPGAYVILEHFTANSEEIVLSNYGMMIWGNRNGPYQQAAMGYPSGPPGTWDFSTISYLNLAWTQPNLVGYMESHDEERLMFKNLIYGNSSGSYNIKDMATALDRMKLVSTFFLPVPGPKMIWMGGEVGYDVSIDYNGRLSGKPFKWDYYTDPLHKKLFNVVGDLIRLKEFYPAFSSNNFTVNASGPTKSIHINDSSMDVTIIGNFDVVAQTMSPAFQTTGKWYEFFSGDSINVSDVNAQINLQPGEYRLYTTVKLPLPGSLTDVKKVDSDLPTKYKLEQNYPNPFNPSTTIRYSIPALTPPLSLRERVSEGQVRVNLIVYDILGREVATLVNKQEEPGNYEVTFNGSKLASGVYLYRLTAGSFSQTKKFVLMK